MTIVAWTLASAFCQLSKRLIEERYVDLYLPLLPHCLSR